MKSNTYDFRQFQQDLAALDGPIIARTDERQTRKSDFKHRLANAKAEFCVLRERYGLTIADVVTFFPEEEGIAYLQALIAAADTMPKPTRKKRS